MHLLSEAGLCLIAFGEDLLLSSPHGGPAGFQSAMSSFKDYAGGSKCQVGERLSERRQSTTLNPNSKFSFMKSASHGMAPKKSKLAARHPIGLQFPKDGLLSPKPFCQICDTGQLGTPPNSATGFPTVPSNRTRVDFLEAY